MFFLLYHLKTLLTKITEKEDPFTNQWTMGGELFTETADFRLNFYYPIEDRILASEIAADEIFVNGNKVIYQQADMNTYYETMGGYDLEIGKRFSEDLPVDIGIYFRTFKIRGTVLK